MRIFLIGFLCIWFCATSSSQDKTCISGVVKGAVSGEPLPYAQIAVQHSKLGTVTNEEGVFRLKVPDAGWPDAGWPDTGSPDSLRVSFLGYQTQTLPVSFFDTAVKEIRMDPVSLELREVEIVALTPLEVLRRVFENIPPNYGKDSLLLTAFIRTQKSVNNKLAEYTEAIVEDLKTGYDVYHQGASGQRSRGPGISASLRHQESNIPKLFKGRVTSDTNLVMMLGEVGASARCLGCNFAVDVAEFPYETVLDGRDQKHYTFTMKEFINPEGGKIYRIGFDQNDKTNKTLYKGEILIDSRDYAILQISYQPSYKAYDAFEKQKYNRTWFLNNRPGWIQEMPLGETTITYTKRDSLWSLSTIRQHYRVTYNHPQTGQRLVYGYKNEVVVTEITRDSLRIRAFRGDKSVGVNQRWDEVVGETDEPFWENFNYLPIETALKEELKRLD